MAPVFNGGRIHFGCVIDFFFPDVREGRFLPDNVRIDSIDGGVVAEVHVVPFVHGLVLRYPWPDVVFVREFLKEYVNEWFVHDIGMGGEGSVDLPEFVCGGSFVFGLFLCMSADFSAKSRAFMAS